MTLIVVDKYRTWADSYARVTDENGTHWESNFPKVFPMNGRVEVESHLSYTTVAFCGDAHGFLAFYEKLEDALNQSPTLTGETLLELSADYQGRPVLVIMPSKGAVIALHLGGDAGPVLEVRKGETQVFGGDYHPNRSVACEDQAWFSIYQDAINAGLLPGPDVHFRVHKTVVDSTEAIPASAVAQRTPRRVWGGLKERLARLKGK